MSIIIWTSGLVCFSDIGMAQQFGTQDVVGIAKNKLADNVARVASRVGANKRLFLYLYEAQLNIADCFEGDVATKNDTSLYVLKHFDQFNRQITIEQPNQSRLVGIFFAKPLDETLPLSQHMEQGLYVVSPGHIENNVRPNSLVDLLLHALYYPTTKVLKDLGEECDLTINRSNMVAFHDPNTENILNGTVVYSYNNFGSSLESYAAFLGDTLQECHKDKDLAKKEYAQKLLLSVPIACKGYEQRSNLVALLDQIPERFLVKSFKNIGSEFSVEEKKQLLDLYEQHADGITLSTEVVKKFLNSLTTTTYSSNSSELLDFLEQGIFKAFDPAVVECYAKEIMHYKEVDFHTVDRPCCINNEIA